jgi:hypothetical protein
MRSAWLVMVMMSAVACGNAADRAGIGGQCAVETDCPKVGDKQLKCLTGFKGGYCGLDGCTSDADCVMGSACVKVAATNYCFRECTDKPECNVNRTVDIESNCVGNADHVGASTAKVCVPPSA